MSESKTKTFKLNLEESQLVLRLESGLAALEFQCEGADIILYLSENDIKPLGEFFSSIEKEL